MYNVPGEHFTRRKREDAIALCWRAHEERRATKTKTCERRQGVGSTYLVMLEVLTLLGWKYLPCCVGSTYLVVLGVLTLSCWEYLPCRD